MATTAEPTTTSEHTHGPTTAKGWGTDAPDQPLRPMEFERRALPKGPPRPSSWPRESTWDHDS